MPTEKLTDYRVKELKSPAAGRLEIFDQLTPGFGIRVTAAGKKSWILMYRFEREKRRFTLGHYPALKLTDARTKARDLLDQVAHGIDPEAVPEPPPLELTVADAFDRYKTDYLSKRRSGDQVVRAMEKDMLPTLGPRALKTVTGEDIADVLSPIVKRGSPYQRNRTRAYMSKFFAWCMGVDNLGSDRIKANPVTETGKIGEASRDRVLSDLELTAIWHGAEHLGYPFCPLVRLLLLLGQRRQEVGGLRWLEIKDNELLWVLPAERAKNDQVHDVPLSPAAHTILRGIPRFVLNDAEDKEHEPEGSPFVFTTTGMTPVSGYSKAKRLLDAAAIRWLTEKAEREGGAPHQMAPWRLHDLRRTLSTGLARKGWPQHVVEKLLNHKSGVTSGIAGVYNRYQYLDERRAAVTAWAEHVLALVHAPQGMNASPSSLDKAA